MSIARTFLGPEAVARAVAVVLGVALLVFGTFGIWRVLDGLEVHDPRPCCGASRSAWPDKHPCWQMRWSWRLIVVFGYVAALLAGMVVGLVRGWRGQLVWCAVYVWLVLVALVHAATRARRVRSAQEPT